MEGIGESVCLCVCVWGLVDDILQGIQPHPPPDHCLTGSDQEDGGGGDNLIVLVLASWNERVSGDRSLKSWTTARMMMCVADGSTTGCHQERSLTNSASPEVADRRTLSSLTHGRGVPLTVQLFHSGLVLWKGARRRKRTAAGLDEDRLEFPSHTLKWKQKVFEQGIFACCWLEQQMCWFVTAQNHGWQKRKWSSNLEVTLYSH